MSGETINNSNKDLIKNIGKRLQKQKEKTGKNTSEDNEENKDTNQKNKSTPEKFQKENKNTKIDIKNINADDNEKNNTYASTYTVTPKMDEIFMNAKLKIRQKFRCSLSKQDAIELGLLLLNNLNDALLNQIAEDYSKEDDLIKILKKYIQENNI
ncbi:MAG: hypothetical protein ACOCRX_10710 [Candidatus Woesearchaeota archaeon]